MSEKTIHPEGAMNLVRAIVNRAVKDYMATTPKSYARKEVESFFLSDHFEILTGSDGQACLKRLEELYNKKHRRGKRG